MKTALCIFSLVALGWGAPCPNLLFASASCKELRNQEKSNPRSTLCHPVLKACLQKPFAVEKFSQASVCLREASHPSTLPYWDSVLSQDLPYAPGFLDIPIQQALDTKDPESAANLAWFYVRCARLSGSPTLMANAFIQAGDTLSALQSLIQYAQSKNHGLYQLQQLLRQQANDEEKSSDTWIPHLYSLVHSRPGAYPRPNLTGAELDLVAQWCFKNKWETLGLLYLNKMAPLSQDKRKQWLARLAEAQLWGPLLQWMGTTKQTSQLSPQEMGWVLLAVRQERQYQMMQNPELWKTLPKDVWALEWLGQGMRGKEQNSTWNHAHAQKWKEIATLPHFQSNPGLDSFAVWNIRLALLKQQGSKAVQLLDQIRANPQRQVHNAHLLFLEGQARLLLNQREAADSCWNLAESYEKSSWARPAMWFRYVLTLGKATGPLLVQSDGNFYSTWTQRGKILDSLHSLRLSPTARHQWHISKATLFLEQGQDSLAWESLNPLLQEKDLGPEAALTLSQRGIYAQETADNLSAKEYAGIIAQYESMLVKYAQGSTGEFIRGRLNVLRNKERTGKSP